MKVAASYATIGDAMPTRRASVTSAVSALTVLSIAHAVLLIPLADAQPGDEYEPPRLRDGKPDLQGIWQVRNSANWDLEHHAGSYGIPAGLGVVVDPADGAIPYQPWAAEQQQQNFQNRETDDPSASCYIAGVPRTMYAPHPFQIFQNVKDIVIAYQFATGFRRLFVDGKDEAPLDAWMGWSNARWEGDTHDAGVVITVRDRGDERLGITMFGVSGRATVAIGKRLTEKMESADDFWSDVVVANGYQIGVYICEISYAPVETGDDASDDGYWRYDEKEGEATVQVTPLSRHVLEEALDVPRRKSASAARKSGAKAGPKPK